jgi:chemotaxis response regulator CheB
MAVQAERLRPTGIANHNLFSILMIKRKFRGVLSMKGEDKEKNFPVVCVGGSAGGLDAYIRLLKHLPADMGVAIVIVNHLRTVATLLHEILPKYTLMPVELITEKLDIDVNRHAIMTHLEG